MHSLLTESEFNSYQAWAKSTWSGKASEPDLRDIAIMGLGFAGEAGEVKTAVDAPLELNSSALKNVLKELGDVVYYAARIVTVFGLKPISSAMTVPAIATDKVRASEYVGSMSVAVSQVCEILKKYIRDGVVNQEQEFQEKLSRAIHLFLAEWMKAVAAVGATPQQVLALNRAKIEDRQARGVLRGSGDNR